MDLSDDSASESDEEEVSEAVVSDTCGAVCVEYSENGTGGMRVAEEEETKADANDGRTAFPDQAERVRGIVAYFLDAVEDNHLDYGVRTALSVWFAAYGLYAISLGPITKVVDGILVFTGIGVWMKTLGGDPEKYRGALLWKFGFTARCFRVRLREVVRKLKRHGFPMDELNPELKGVVVGLPREMVKLLAAEETVRNKFSDTDLRLRRHASSSESRCSSFSRLSSISSDSENSAMSSISVSSKTSEFSRLSSLSGDEEKPRSRSEMVEFVRGEGGASGVTWNVYLECIDRLNKKWHEGPLSEARKVRLIKHYHRISRGARATKRPQTQQRSSSKQRQHRYSRQRQSMQVQPRGKGVLESSCDQDKRTASSVL